MINSVLLILPALQFLSDGDRHGRPLPSGTAAGRFLFLADKFPRADLGRYLGRGGAVGAARPLGRRRSGGHPGWRGGGAHGAKGSLSCRSAGAAARLVHCVARYLAPASLKRTSRSRAKLARSGSAAPPTARASKPIVPSTISSSTRSPIRSRSTLCGRSRRPSRREGDAENMSPKERR